MPCSSTTITTTATATANMRFVLLLASGTAAMFGTTHAGSSAASSAHPPIQAKEDGFQSPLGAGTAITARSFGTAHQFDANGNTRSNTDADASNGKGNGKTNRQISADEENSGEI